MGGLVTSTLTLGGRNSITTVREEEMEMVVS